LKVPYRERIGTKGNVMQKPARSYTVQEVNESSEVTVFHVLAHRPKWIIFTETTFEGKYYSRKDAEEVIAELAGYPQVKGRYSYRKDGSRDYSW
jgi:hypothetical protein